MKNKKKQELEVAKSTKKRVLATSNTSKNGKNPSSNGDEVTKKSKLTTSNNSKYTENGTSNGEKSPNLTTSNNKEVAKNGKKHTSNGEKSDENGTSLVPKSRKLGKLWQDTHYITAYELAKSGMSDGKIAKTMGVTISRIALWKQKNPAFKEALLRGRQSAPTQTSNGTNIFLDYCYKRLPENIKQIWDEVVNLDVSTENEHIVEKMIQGQGQEVKQFLWIHALISSNFIASEACRVTSIPMSSVSNWKKNSPEFGEMVRWILSEGKKDFIEGAYLGLVARGDSPAIIHGVKTLVSDRGYGNKSRLEISGGVQHLHEDMETEDILNELSIEEQARILEIIRAKREGRALPPKELLANEVEIHEDFRSENHSESVS